MHADTILHRRLRFTLFFSRYADRKQEKESTCAEMAAVIRTTTAHEKERLPWIKLATFGDLRTNQSSMRHDANVLEITGIEADYDAEVVDFDAAHERLEKRGLASILYTSPSHTKGRPRWRVLCPLSRSMAPQHRRHMLGRLNGLFGGIFSSESWALSQSYFFGSVRNNPTHRVELVDGQAIDLHDDLDRAWIGKPGVARSANPSGSDTGEVRDDAELVRRIVTGDGFHVEMCALAGRYLARGMTRTAAAEVLSGMMLSHSESARDARWHDRFKSIPTLVASAATKFCDETVEGRRAVARMIAQMMRASSPSSEIRASAYSEAERYNLPPKVADDIAAWLYRRERARLGGDHA